MLKNGIVFVWGDIVENNTQTVPFIVHESAMARMERTIRRLWIALLISICLWAATVGLVIFYESQFEDVVTESIETSADGGGDAYA